MGIKNTVISLELADRHIFDYEEKMLTTTLQEAVAQNTFPDFVREDSLQIALRSSYSFYHDNATVTYLLFLAGGNGPGDSIDGGFQRLWIDYKYTDSVSLNAGVVDYIGGDGIIPFTGLSKTMTTYLWKFNIAFNNIIDRRKGRLMDKASDIKGYSNN